MPTSQALLWFSYGEDRAAVKYSFKKFQKIKLYSSYNFKILLVNDVEFYEKRLIS